MRALSAVVVVLAVLAGGVVHAQQAAASPSLLKTGFGKLPIYFIENRGVHPDAVAHYVEGADKTLFFSKEGIATVGVLSITARFRPSPCSERERNEIPSCVTRENQRGVTGARLAGPSRVILRGDVLRKEP